MELGTEKIRGGHAKNRVTQRREQARFRQALRDKLTPKQQLAVLDERFGKALGAKKERARLQKQIEATTETSTKKKGDNRKKKKKN